MTTPGPSGFPMPVGDMAGWKQQFSDDFTTVVAEGSWPGAMASTWSQYGPPTDTGPGTPGNDTSGNGVFQLSNISSGQGPEATWMQLHLFTPTSSDYVNKAGGIAANVCAPLPKMPGMGAQQGYKYGRYDVCATADATLTNFKTAWLCWPADQIWRYGGEHDFPEGNIAPNLSESGYGSQSIQGAIHTLGAPAINADIAPASGITLSSGWHVYSQIWLPGSITYQIDYGATYSHTYSGPNAGHMPMYWVLQTETQLPGSWGAPPSSQAGYIYIDWVSVYSKGPSRGFDKLAGARYRS